MAIEIQVLKPYAVSAITPQKMVADRSSVKTLLGELVLVVGEVYVNLSGTHPKRIWRLLSDFPRVVAPKNLEGTALLQAFAEQKEAYSYNSLFMSFVEAVLAGTGGGIGVDVATAIGMNLPAIQKAGKFERLIGIDILPEHAREAQRSFGKNGILALAGNAFKLPLAPGSVRFVSILGLLHYPGLLQQFLDHGESLLSKLTPDGVFLCIEPTRGAWPLLLTLMELARLGKKISSKKQEEAAIATALWRSVRDTTLLGLKATDPEVRAVKEKFGLEAMEVSVKIKGFPMPPILLIYTKNARLGPKKRKVGMLTATFN